MKINIDFNFLLSEKKFDTRSDDDENLVMMNDNKMIENPYKISNYEIIGDFGKELEQEMGLIMAEYSIKNDTNISSDDFMKNYTLKAQDTDSSSVDNTPNSHLSNAVLHSKILQKMRDASCDELSEHKFKDLKNCINMIGNNCYFNGEFRRESVEDLIGCKVSTYLSIT